MTMRRILAAIVGAHVLAFSTASAQGADPAMLLHPPPDAWPTYHGDYSGQRHSTLSQITPDNVSQLSLAWAFLTNQSDQIKASPILHNGVIYISTPDNLWAIDARAAGSSGATRIRQIRASTSVTAESPSTGIVSTSRLPTHTCSRSTREPVR